MADYYFQSLLLSHYENAHWSIQNGSQLGDGSIRYLVHWDKANMHQWSSTEPKKSRKINQKKHQNTYILISLGKEKSF